MQVKTLSPATWVISLLAVLQTSPIAHASPDCESRSGNSVVVNIGREDPIGGLAVRAAPNPQAPIKTVIPAAGTGVAIGSCHGDGWCEVTFECVGGWSLAARYLAPRDQQLYRVTNVSPNDPEGLNVRSGPGLAYSPKGNIPYNGDGIVLHDCQADGRWCLVTYGEISGWSARQLLAPMTVAVEVRTRAESILNRQRPVRLQRLSGVDHRNSGGARLANVARYRRQRGSDTGKTCRPLDRDGTCDRRRRFPGQHR